MKPILKHPPESKMIFDEDIRRWRDIVYGIPSTDANWEGCKENWMKPESVAWLREKMDKT